MTYNEKEMTWNNLQRPETTYKEKETTYNELTSNKQNKPRNDQKQADFEIILQYGSIGSLF